ncbi:MAG: hypothetical protein MUF78_03935 [Candidatus Edwardsbacteria bacterium]|nr:hypothetical protein [Candidatus Edwardsbacteria bacterium]
MVPAGSEMVSPSCMFSTAFSSASRRSSSCLRAVMSRTTATIRSGVPSRITIRADTSSTAWRPSAARTRYSWPRRVPCLASSRRSCSS